MSSRAEALPRVRVSGISSFLMGQTGSVLDMPLLWLTVTLPPAAGALSVLWSEGILFRTKGGGALAAAALSVQPGVAPLGIGFACAAQSSALTAEN